MESKSKREGIYVHIWLIHFIVPWKLTQLYSNKIIIIIIKGKGNQSLIGLISSMTLNRTRNPKLSSHLLRFYTSFLDLYVSAFA